MARIFYVHWNKDEAMQAVRDRDSAKPQAAAARKVK